MTGIVLRVVNLRAESADVRVDRQTRYGNPYRIGPGRGRAEAMALHAADVQPGMGVVVDLAEEVVAAAEKKIAALARRPRSVEVTLGCWCHPAECHADTLARLVARLLP